MGLILLGRLLLLLNRKKLFENMTVKIITIWYG